MVLRGAVDQPGPVARSVCAYYQLLPAPADLVDLRAAAFGKYVLAPPLQVLSRNRHIVDVLDEPKLSQRLADDVVGDKKRPGSRNLEMLGDNIPISEGVCKARSEPVDCTRVTPS